MARTSLPILDNLSTSDFFSPHKIVTYPEALSAVQNDAPLPILNLEINPVNTCNQSCTWCTYGYLHDRREAMNTETILALLRDASELGVKSVTWTGGGEPTVFKQLPEVIEAAAQYKFRQGINTNGSLLTGQLIDLFTQHFSYVRFSVDAGSPEVYSRTHQVRFGSFARVTGNIAALVNKRNATESPLTIGFSFLVDNSNVSDLLAAARLAKSIGVDYFQLKPIVNYIESNEQFSASSSMWKEMESQMDEVFALEDDHYQVRFLGHKFEDIKLQEKYYGRTYDQCRGNEVLATVGADASVDVCCAYKGMKDWSFGNLTEKSFKEIWEGEQRRRVLERIDVTKCPPLCKAHEINKIFHYVRNFNAHREFP
ncbi:MAG TPA: radical SAM protein [Pyrinomonadaceae bacterium]|nr:radical SAM protein [Pyrinomonadaceae bacterium]